MCIPFGKHFCQWFMYFRTQNSNPKFKYQIHSHIQACVAQWDLNTWLFAVWECYKPCMSATMQDFWPSFSILFGFVRLRHGCCPLLWMWLNFGNNTALAPLHLAMQNWVRYEEGIITLGSLTQRLGRKKSRQMFGTNTLWSPKEIWNRSSGGVTVSFVLLKGKRKHIRKPDCGAQEVSLWLIKRNWCEVGSDAVISQSSLEQQEELFRRNQRAKLHI